MKHNNLDKALAIMIMQHLDHYYDELEVFDENYCSNELDLHLWLGFKIASKERINDLFFGDEHVKIGQLWPTPPQEIFVE